ncbi:HelD family protein [Brevibacterium otitidis]|uniref:HelD family protein n=1 Tax=Brevibacterium otitidis TaxID=53364 RepID=A0ABV5X776_9MICO|nr:AAA family ATPase [Brevibacterium otitidis]
MSEETEISYEQQHLDTVYARLDALREETAASLSQVRRTHVGGNHQNRSERDAFASMYEDQLIRLRSAEEGLCFGRIDSVTGSTTYIGRIGISAHDRTQLLMDWRAPASEPFYRATAENPLDLARRRHIATRRRTVVSVEDDVLDLEALSDQQRAGLHGEGALIASLDAHRTGRMGDIVATIQAEQDRIIRRPLDRLVVVQGGPGTGKTAVALHRAAYLLYQHRERIAKSGVLLIGPSPVFLKYIEQVLPSLGETGAVLLTPGQLMPEVNATAHDRPAAAAVKGDLRMAEVIRKAVRAYQRVPREPKPLKTISHTVTMTPAMVKEAQERARRSGKPHNGARLTFVRHLLSLLAAELAAVKHYEPTPEVLAELTDELRRSQDVRVAINLCWLPLTPRGVLDALLSKPHRLVPAADRILSLEEMAAIRRVRGSAITVEDVPLLDEIAELIGPATEVIEAQERGERPSAEVEYAEAVLEMTGTGALVSAETIASRYEQDVDERTLAERAMQDREWTYGHLVVDEAQELSPMQWRLLFRRVPSKSATVVGDLAQASTMDAERTWSSVLAPHVGDRFEMEELTVSYRTPGRIMTVANGLLQEYFPQLAVPSPVREGSYDPLAEGFADVAQLCHELPGIVRQEREELGGGQVAVITMAEHLDQVVAALASDPQSDFAAGTAGIDHAVAVLEPGDVRGLEFDSVIIVDPASIAPAGSAAGVGQLYVALTRSTARLRILSIGESVLQPFISAQQHR